MPLLITNWTHMVIYNTNENIEKLLVESNGSPLCLWHSHLGP